jgi:hypothetical protein
LANHRLGFCVQGTILCALVPPAASLNRVCRSRVVRFVYTQFSAQDNSNLLVGQASQQCQPSVSAQRPTSQIRFGALLACERSGVGACPVCIYAFNPASPVMLASMHTTRHGLAAQSRVGGCRLQCPGRIQPLRLARPSLITKSTGKQRDQGRPSCQQPETPPAAPATASLSPPAQTPWQLRF